MWVEFINAAQTQTYISERSGIRQKLTPSPSLPVSLPVFSWCVSVNKIPGRVARLLRCYNGVWVWVGSKQWRANNLNVDVETRHSFVRPVGFMRAGDHRLPLKEISTNAAWQSRRFRFRCCFCFFCTLFLVGWLLLMVVMVVVVIFWLVGREVPVRSNHQSIECWR